MKSCQSISFPEYFPITTFSIFITNISEIHHSRQINISWISRPPKNQNFKIKFSFVTLISFGIWVLTNLSVSKHILLICKRHLKAYLKLLLCNCEEMSLFVACAKFGFSLLQNYAILYLWYDQTYMNNHIWSALKIFYKTR